MHVVKRIYKTHKHNFKSKKKGTIKPFYGMRHVYRQRKAMLENTQGRKMPERIKNTRSIKNFQIRRLERVFRGLKKHHAILTLLLKSKPYYVKKYRSKRPRYARGLPHTIAGDQMRVDFEERQKLIDEGNQKAVDALCKRIHLLERCVDDLLCEVVDGDTVFEVIQFKVSTTKAEKIKNALIDVSWNPWSDRPKDYNFLDKQTKSRKSEQ